MREPLSSNAWRAATLALASGWVVMACGGGGGEAAGEAPLAVITSPVIGAAAAASQVAAVQPCWSPAHQATPRPVRRDTAEIEREFSAELRSDPALGLGTGAGSTEIADPFEAPR